MRSATYEPRHALAVARKPKNAAKWPPAPLNLVDIAFGIALRKSAEATSFLRLEVRIALWNRHVTIVGNRSLKKRIHRLQ